MEEEINLIDIYRVLKKRFKMILIFISVSLCMALVYIQLTTKIYEATAVILPLGGGSGGGNGVMLLAQVAGLAGGNFGMSNKSTIDIPMLLKSRSFAERVAAKLDLPKHYYSKLWDSKNNKWDSSLKAIPTNQDAAFALLANIKAETDLNNGGVLSLKISDKDPKMALEINRTVLSELNKYINDNTLTESKRQRIFVGKQVVSNKKELLEVGKELGSFYQKNSVSAVSSVIDIDLGSLDISLDYDEPLVLQNQLNEKVKILQDQKEVADKKNEREQVKKVPQQVYLEYLTQKKLILATLNGMLSQQYEMAKMQEAKEDLSFLTIDEAIQPTDPSKPRVKFLLALTFVSSVFMSFFSAFFIEYIQSLNPKKENP